MENRIYAPMRYRAPLGYGLPSLWPFRGLIGTGLTLAGLLVIANFIAPQLVEQALPGWKSQYGIFVFVAVILGFLRSVLRLIIPVMSLGFWIVAICALTHFGAPKGVSLPAVPTFISGPAQAAPVVTPERNTKPIHGTKSLPDAVYFPAAQNQGLKELSKIPGVSSIAKLLR